MAGEGEKLGERVLVEEREYADTKTNGSHSLFSQYHRESAQTLSSMSGLNQSPLPALHHTVDGHSQNYLLNTEQCSAPEGAKRAELGAARPQERVENGEYVQNF